MDRTKVRNAVGVALAAALLLLTLLGSGYFIFTLKVGFVQWLVFNACSPTSLVYLVCVTIFWLKGNTALLPFALLPMYYFGTMGAFYLHLEWCKRLCTAIAHHYDPQYCVGSIRSL